jgi:hypothetical protein
MGRFSVHSVVLLTAVLLAIFPCSVLAQVSSGDASATSAYLKDEYALTRAEATSFPAGIAAVEALAGKVRTECPGVLANAPKPAPGTAPSSTEEQISEVELDAVFSAGARTEHARLERFAHEVAQLHWGDGVLTRLVHSHATDEAARAAIPAPDLCADMRSWVASGYETISAATEGYLHVEAALSATIERAKAAIKRKLPQYESRSDTRIAHKIVSLENAEPLMLKEFFAALGKVGEALVTAAPASGN